MEILPCNLYSFFGFPHFLYTPSGPASPVVNCPPKSGETWLKHVETNPSHGSMVSVYGSHSFPQFSRVYHLRGRPFIEIRL